MAKVEVSRTFPGKNIDQLVAAFAPAFAQAGFQIGRLRPVGWLVLASKKDSIGEIQSNLSARPGNPVTVTLILTSNVHSQDELTKQTEAVWQALSAL